MEDLGRPIRLQMTSRVLTLAKDPDWPDENQDYCRVDEARGLAAMADGVASAIFSRLWARILVTAAVEGLPDPDDREVFARWLAERRQDEVGMGRRHELRYWSGSAWTVHVSDNGVQSDDSL